MMTTEERIEAEWIYAGVRILKGGKLGHAWVDDVGEERYFAKMRARTVGGVYTVTVSVDRGTLYGTPTYLRQSDDERVPTWDAESREARTRKDAQSAEKAAAKEKPIRDLTIGEVQAMMARALPVRRAALLAVVLQELGA